jgi:hypothetical protein
MLTVHRHDRLLVLNHDHMSLLLIVSYLSSWFVIPAHAGIQALFKLVPGFRREDD